MLKKYSFFVSFIILLIPFTSIAQNVTELNSGWKCIAVSSEPVGGEKISNINYSLKGYMPATVPGTILTTLLNNQKIADPFYGMNNKYIPDIDKTGNTYYTYWFVKDFTATKTAAQPYVFLNFRGVNYTSELYVNGHKIDQPALQGMFLRQSYNISPFLAADGKNRLAILVHPAPIAGDINGGQGGDGTIARNVALQYTAGWDWIQPIHDRNTGIWDKVTLQQAGEVRIKDAHIITLVPGVRMPDGPQAPAQIKAGAELENLSNKPIRGVLKYTIDGQIISKEVTLASKSVTQVSLPDLALNNPKLWWPNGYGLQNLYDTKFQFLVNGHLSDENNVKIGVRQIETEWNSTTQSRQIEVNGQKIFIKGGNWIVSDAMLRFSNERYDAEIRYHHDMNLNLIRVWGGALIERPEFYAACDKYGLLVFQDLWMSGDCNGRWMDPMKKDDQWTRRKYPDDHKLYLASAIDQIKMVRNHPSLAIWCAGNEIPPPDDILAALKDTIMPKLDNTRIFIEYSNSGELSYNSIGGNGDGPYGIQPIATFWQYRTFPFNSEVGSVGIGDYESLARFIPQKDLLSPEGKKEDSVWRYHKYTGVGYDQYVDAYGKPKEVADFAMKAQLVNYDQYRGLIEGFSSHMWDWYTGTIIWKTQNPWTAMRGQMYDYYLDPNACLYGLRSGSEPLHIMYNPVDGMITGVNNTFQTYRNMMLVVKTYDMSGKDSLITQVFSSIGPSSVQKYFSVKEEIDALREKKGVFLSLQLLNSKQQVISNNFYWLPDSSKQYSGLQNMKPAVPELKAKKIAKGKIEVSWYNPSNNPVAFFNRVSLVDPVTNKRILPAFYDDNYFSVVPGETKKVIIEYNDLNNSSMPVVSVVGWNVAATVCKVDL